MGSKLCINNVKLNLFFGFDYSFLSLELGAIYLRRVCPPKKAGFNFAVT